MASGTVSQANLGRTQMKKILDRVTVTGADESCDIQEMHDLQKRFPFMEWGILLSRSAEGRRSRFPSLDWMCKMVAGHEHYAHPFKLAGHICGGWVQDICKGNWSFIKERPEVCGYFDRFQLNFHGARHKIDPDKFIQGFDNPVLHRKYLVEKGWPKMQIIFQLDEVNDELLQVARKAGIDAVGLYDTSHGAGILPNSWPTNDTYVGYAGGLGPDNLEEQLNKIAEVCTPPIWIDAETKLRSDDDKIFDLQKVRRFLEIAEPWVI